MIPVLFDRAVLDAGPARRRRARSAGPADDPVRRPAGPAQAPGPGDRAPLPATAGAPGARLVLVGTPPTHEFAGRCAGLPTSSRPARSTSSAGISRARLAAHYRRRDAFLCLSEHEGFCIPLLEAFHFGLPVIARDAGAVAEVRRRRRRCCSAPPTGWRPSPSCSRSWSATASCAPSWRARGERAARRLRPRPRPRSSCAPR